MGKAQSKLSPQGVMRREQHLRKKQNKDKLKPPYPCPICDTTDGVTLLKKSKQKKQDQGKSIFTFACRKGCFKQTVELNSVNFEPIDGYNKIIDDLHQIGKIL